MLYRKKKQQQQMFAVPHLPVEGIRDLMTQFQIKELTNKIAVADVAREINMHVGLISKQLTLVGQLRDALDGARKKVKKKTTTRSRLRSRRKSMRKGSRKKKQPRNQQETHSR